MKKIILGTVLACLASGSVMADDNSLFNKHCRFDRVVDGVRVSLDLAIKGGDTFAKTRLTSPGHPRAKVESFTNNGDNLFGESRYYKSYDTADEMMINAQNTEITIVNGLSGEFITFECE